MLWPGRRSGLLPGDASRRAAGWRLAAGRQAAGAPALTAPRRLRAATTPAAGPRRRQWPGRLRPGSRQQWTPPGGKGRGGGAVGSVIGTECGPAGVPPADAALMPACTCGPWRPAKRVLREAAPPFSHCALLSPHGWHEHKRRRRRSGLPCYTVNGRQACNSSPQQRHRQRSRLGRWPCVLTESCSLKACTQAPASASHTRTLPSSPQEARRHLPLLLWPHLTAVTGPTWPAQGGGVSCFGEF